MRAKVGCGAFFVRSEGLGWWWTVGARVIGRWKQAGLGNGFVMIEGYEFTMV